MNTTPPIHPKGQFLQWDFGVPRDYIPSPSGYGGERGPAHLAEEDWENYKAQTDAKLKELGFYLID